MQLIRFMVFNTTFNNISVISRRSGLLVVKSEYPKKSTDMSQVTDTLYYIMLHRVHLAMNGFELTTFVVMGTDCTGSCKSNYHMITATTAPINLGCHAIRVSLCRDSQNNLDFLLNSKILNNIEKEKKNLAIIINNINR
jgi:hypothetical protein